MDRKTYKKEYIRIYIKTCKAKKCEITTNNYNVNRQVKKSWRHWKWEIYRIPYFYINGRRILIFLK